jgi:hypothetical protein
MAGCPRPNKKAMKLAYKILNTPKDKQQLNQTKPSEKMLKGWYRDSSTAQ